MQSELETSAVNNSTVVGFSFQSSHSMGSIPQGFNGANGGDLPEYQYSSHAATSWHSYDAGYADSLTGSMGMIPVWGSNPW